MSAELSRRTLLQMIPALAAGLLAILALPRRFRSALRARRVTRARPLGPAAGRRAHPLRDGDVTEGHELAG